MMASSMHDVISSYHSTEACGEVRMASATAINASSSFLVVGTSMADLVMI